MRADDLPDNIKRLNPQIFDKTAMPLMGRPVSEGKKADMGKIPSAALPSKIDARNAKLDNMPKLNKTEMRFFRDCLADADGVVIAQPTRFFRLTGGGTYTPDFILIHGGGVNVYEIKMKGARYHGWEQGYERYKRAAYEFSRLCIVFIMAVWDGKAKKWDAEVWRD